MADRRARTSSLPEEDRVRQHCPFAPVTPQLEDERQGRVVDFPCSVNWYKKGRRRAARALRPALPKTTAHRSNLLSSQWFEMNRHHAAAEEVVRERRGEGKKRWGVMTRGAGGVRGSLWLFGVGGLCLVEVAGAALCVVVRQVDGGAVQIEVATSWAAGGEAADLTPTPGQNKVTEQLQPHFVKYAHSQAGGEHQLATTKGSLCPRRAYQGC